jgi:hypothetical protein
MRLSSVLAGIIVVTVAAVGGALHFGFLSIHIPTKNVEAKSAQDGDPGYACHEEAPRLCHPLADHIREGRVSRTPSISPQAYPLDLDWNALNPDGSHTMLNKQYELYVYLSENFDRPITLHPSPKLKNKSCEILGEIEIRRLGDMFLFFDQCSQIVDVADSRFLSIGLVLQSEITDEVRPLLEYLYAINALATYKPYDFGFPVHSFYLELGSPGGDPFAAMDAGDLVFETFRTVMVKQAGCASACVFLLAAGKDRIIVPWDYAEIPTNAMDLVDQAIAIHSPLPTSETVTTLDELATIRSQFRKEATVYLERFGVSSSLVDMMMSIPSEQVRYLTYSELEALRLVGENTVQIDLDRLDRIRACGSEFDQRLVAYYAALEAQCDGSVVTKPGERSPYWACRNQLIRDFKVTTRDCEEGGELLLDLDVSFGPIEP